MMRTVLFFLKFHQTIEKDVGEGVVKIERSNVARH